MTDERAITVTYTFIALLCAFTLADDAPRYARLCLLLGVLVAGATLIRRLLE